MWAISREYFKSKSAMQTSASFLLPSTIPEATVSIPVYPLSPLTSFPCSKCSPVPHWHRVSLWTHSKIHWFRLNTTCDYSMERLYPSFKKCLSFRPTVWQCDCQFGLSTATVLFDCRCLYFTDHVYGDQPENNRRREQTHRAEQWEPVEGASWFKPSPHLQPCWHSASTDGKTTASGFAPSLRLYCQHLKQMRLLRDRREHYSCISRALLSLIYSVEMLDLGLCLISDSAACRTEPTMVFLPCTSFYSTPPQLSVPLHKVWKFHTENLFLLLDQNIDLFHWAQCCDPFKADKTLPLKSSMSYMSSKHRPNPPR